MRPGPPSVGLEGLMADLLARKACDQCGGPLFNEGARGRCAYNWPVGKDSCGVCYDRDMDQLDAEQQANYWAARAEAERECNER